MIKRDKYLAELVSLQGNGMIKVITGMRRCGKSYLLFEIFVSYLAQRGVASDHIIKVDLEDFKNRELRNPAKNLFSTIPYNAVFTLRTVNKNTLPSQCERRLWCSTLKDNSTRLAYRKICWRVIFLYGQ
jgi:ATPase